MSTVPKSVTAGGHGHVIGQDQYNGGSKAAARALVHLGQGLVPAHHQDALRLLVLGRGGQRSRGKDGLELLVLNGCGREAPLGVAVGHEVGDGHGAPFIVLPESKSYLSCLSILGRRLVLLARWSYSMLLAC